MAPNTQKAIVVTETGSTVLKDTGVPKLGPGQILVKVAAAAQNPADWKTAQNRTKTGSILGCDFAGTVVEIGPDVAQGARTIGERVAGFVAGGSGLNGSFSEYLVTSAEVVVHVPDDWSFEDAAQLGVAPFTAVQTLYESQDLPTPLAPTSTSTPILVSGGSSSVGLYVIQFAKLAGLHVLTTSSPKNFDLLRSFGADEVFDYNDPDASKKIKEATKGQLKCAVDTIAELQTPKQVSDALSDEGGVVSIILNYPSPRPEVEVVFSLGYTLLENTENGKKIAKLLSDILATGKVRPNPLLLLPHGLASVAEGLQFMKDGKVSGQKITYRISDTPN